MAGRTSYDDHHGVRPTDVNSMEVHEAGTTSAFWSILDASGEPIPRTDLPTKQGFIGFVQLKDHT